MKKIRIVSAGILLIILGIIITSIIINYRITANETYLVNYDNLVEDPSFENFNSTVGDCCNGNQGIANISAELSNDSIDLNHSLKLTSYNHCACVSKPMINMTNYQKYYITFYYKGDSPNLCIWSEEDNKCLNTVKLKKSDNWTVYEEVIEPSNKTISPSIFLYASSSGQKVTNLYDGIKVNSLISVYNDVKFYDDEQYIIKTKKENIVSSKCMKTDLIDNGEENKCFAREIYDDSSGYSYYLIQGTPIITVKFPINEIIFSVILLLIITRLLWGINKKEDNFVQKKNDPFNVLTDKGSAVSQTKTFANEENKKYYLNGINSFYGKPLRREPEKKPENSPKEYYHYKYGTAKNPIDKDKNDFFKDGKNL